MDKIDCIADAVARTGSEKPHPLSIEAIFSNVTTDPMRQIGGKVSWTIPDSSLLSSMGSTQGDSTGKLDQIATIPSSLRNNTRILDPLSSAVLPHPSKCNMPFNAHSRLYESCRTVASLILDGHQLKHDTLESLLLKALDVLHELPVNEIPLQTHTKYEEKKNTIMKSLRNHLIRKPATYNLDKVFPFSSQSTLSMGEFQPQSMISSWFPSLPNNIAPLPNYSGLFTGQLLPPLPPSNALTLTIPPPPIHMLAPSSVGHSIYEFQRSMLP
ncbi:hypothetical protein PRIPAC_95502 [Pristionchus pacificus]|uniref:Uncharacterized protein n=1 Tax=Pristionchus pacificus TaxID=54126 RepID=A0A2A6D0Z2_PRIPA|nr:hypothetical protein PRIPAC_95502 [Pristionchus pacificus]|eukprot:PDM84048.1 hypothetical protein PRIPAC_34240 [Pristionchus pacificus]